MSLARGTVTVPHRAAPGGPGDRAAPTRREPSSSDERLPLEHLTPRETEVLQALASGLSTPEISARLGITRNTLRTHVHNIIGKLSARSKLEAVLTAIRLGIVEPPHRDHEPKGHSRTTE